MDTLLRANADELNESFLLFIKNSFKGKRIAVYIYEDAQDETEYLLSDPQHRNKLLQTISEVNGQKGLKQYTMEDLKQQFLNEP